MNRLIVVRLIRLFVVFVSVLLCADRRPSAQSRAAGADLSGVVLDQTLAVLPNVPIVVTHLETNDERTTTSGADGRFIVAALRPGAYRIRVELQGFAPYIAERVELGLGSFASLEIVLKLALTETVVERVQPTLEELERAVAATTITQQQIESLPINGRNFISFSLITPGVIADRMPIQGATATSGLSFGGQRARSNNITVDGLDNNDGTVGSVRATFSQEAVQEFQVLAHGTSAEFGRASGGIVNIITKSGGNRASGSVFGYFRDDGLNAKGYFEQFAPSGQPLTQAKAPFSQQQFGGVFGGPIVKNRTFFFGAFERLDADTSNFVTIDDTTPVIVAGRTVGTAVDVLEAAGFPIETGHVPYRITSNSGVFKVDHNVSTDHRLTVRYNFATGYHENTETWGGLVARSRGAALRNRDHMGAGSLTTLLSDRAVNELRFQVARRDQSLIPLDPTCVGICDQQDEGGPTIEVSGVAMAGRVRTAPQVRNTARYQLVDTVSRQSGSHLLKAGVDFNAVDHFASTMPVHFGGRYIFTPLPAVPGLLPTPVSAIEAVALGLPAVYIQGYGDPFTSYTVMDLSAFVQDQWRVSRSLTLHAGLRYQTQMWPERQYHAPVLGPYSIPADRNDLAPRVSATWAPRSSDLAVHSSYGIYYDNIITALVGLADVINGTSVRTVVLRFPQSIAGWSAPNHRLPESLAGSSPNLVAVLDPDLRTSYSHQFSVGIDRTIAGIWLSGTFLLSEGRNQLGPLDYNPLVASLGPGRRPDDVNGQSGTTTTVLQFTSYGHSSYRAFSIAARRRIGARARFMTSYVLSKADDNSSDFQSAFVPQDQGRGRDHADPTGLPIGFNRDLDTGPSVQDQRHRFVLSGTYAGIAGVEFAGIVSAASGVPFNILAGADLNGDGDAGTFPVDRARRTLSDPASSVARNAGRLPSESTVDVRVSRRWRLTRGATVEPIFEVFNLFNHTNITAVNNVFGTGSYPDSPLSTYGQFQQSAPPRQAQIAARLTF